jgi:antitoxin (DNA-binding transcriptional repressor) of toxin-antitoxin stability system
MSDVMSDMKTSPKPAKKNANPVPEPRREFTVRDLNRHTAELLEAARQHGSVTVRSRAGEQFTVSTKRPADLIAKDFEERMRLHRERLAAVGYKEPTAEGWEAIAKAIAGE